MAARDDARTNSFSDPGRDDVVPNLSFNATEIAGAYTEFARVSRMDPKRIRVRNLVKPFCVCAASVNLHGKAESRDEDRLIFFEFIRMNVALEVTGNCVFGPAPGGQSVRIKLQPPTRCREAAFYFAIYHNSGKASIIFIAIRQREWNNVWPGGFWRAREYTSKAIFTNIFQFFWPYSVFVDIPD